MQAHDEAPLGGQRTPPKPLASKPGLAYCFLRWFYHLTF
jgi:hypothetical protein